MLIIHCAHCHRNIFAINTIMETDHAIANYMAHMVEHHWPWMEKGHELHLALVNGNISGDQFTELMEKTNAEEQQRFANPHTGDAIDAAIDALINRLRRS